METGSFQSWLALWRYAVLMSSSARGCSTTLSRPRAGGNGAGAGLVQAFIIALYAEMYGFPLTIYVLVSVLQFGIPLMHYSGHLWATLLEYGRVGAIVEMAVG